MLELLLPRTDAGVAVQAVVVAVVGLAVIWITRRDETWRVFAVGAFMLAVALLGVRALH
jgi:hypothetical protein